MDKKAKIFLRKQKAKLEKQNTDNTNKIKVAQERKNKCFSTLENAVTDGIYPWASVEEARQCFVISGFFAEFVIECYNCLSEIEDDATELDVCTGFIKNCE